MDDWNFTYLKNFWRGIWNVDCFLAVFCHNIILLLHMVPASYYHLSNDENNWSYILHMFNVFYAEDWLIWRWNYKGSFILYGRKIFQKSNISYPLCMGVRNVSFFENFAFLLNKWSLISNGKFLTALSYCYGNYFCK